MLVMLAAASMVFGCARREDNSDGNGPGEADGTGGRGDDVTQEAPPPAPRPEDAG